MKLIKNGPIDRLITQRVGMLDCHQCGYKFNCRSSIGEFQASAVRFLRGG